MVAFANPSLHERAPGIFSRSSLGYRQDPRLMHFGFRDISAVDLRYPYLVDAGGKRLEGDVESARGARGQSLSRKVDNCGP